jgi:hypothetical protein
VPSKAPLIPASLMILASTKFAGHSNFQNLFDAKRKIALWRRDYNEQRPHSSLNYRTPAEFAREMSYEKDVGSAHFENADGVSNFPTATAAAG